MKNISPNRKLEEKFKRFKLFLSTKVLKRLYKPAMYLVGAQLIAIPAFFHYNRPLVKYALGIHSKADLLPSSKLYKSRLNDLSRYFKDIYFSTFNSIPLEKVYLEIDLKNASIINCSNKDGTNKCPTRQIAKAILKTDSQVFKVTLRKKV